LTFPIFQAFYLLEGLSDVLKILLKILDKKEQIIKKDSHSKLGSKSFEKNSRIF